MKAKARSKAKCAMHIHSIAIELRDFLGDEMKRKEDSGMCSEKISLINNFVKNIDLFFKYYCCCCCWLLLFLSLAKSENELNRNSRLSI